MAHAAIPLASDEAAHVNGKRFMAIEWNEEQGKHILLIILLQQHSGLFNEEKTFRLINS